MNTETLHLQRTRWRKRGFLVVLLVLLGCESSGMDRRDEPPNEPDPSPKIHESTGLPEADAPPMRIAANDERVRAPMDATPSPGAERVYYTALLRDENEDAPGVFTVDGAGGGEVETLATGGVLAAPVGISVSLDGEMLFIADTGTSDAEQRVGAIVALAAAGGTPVALAGTEGYAPRGVVVSGAQGGEQVYFSGNDPESGQGGVFRIAPQGGAPERLAADAGLIDPAGVAVSDNGDIYVVDTLGSSGLASVVRIREGEATTIASDLGVGFPAGIAVTTDGGTVLVSGLDPRTRRDLVYIVNSESLEVAVVAKPIAGFSEPAGLHRAHESNTFAWADAEANDWGTVYMLEL